MNTPNLEKRDALGRFMASRRSELGISMNEVARKVGMTSGSLSQIESGRHHRSAFSLLKIFYVLGCEIPEEFQTPELKELMEFLQKMKMSKDPLDALRDFLVESGLQDLEAVQALEMLRFVIGQQKAGYSLQSLCMQREGIVVQLQFSR